jgi:hypothetical protein
MKIEKNGFEWSLNQIDNIKKKKKARRQKKQINNFKIYELGRI